MMMTMTMMMRMLVAAGEPRFDERPKLKLHGGLQKMLQVVVLLYMKLMTHYLLFGCDRETSGWIFIDAQLEHNITA